MADEPRASLIEFPCAFPLKIMGVKVDAFAQTVAEVVLRHDASFDPATIEMRPSSKGTYLSLTCTVWAVSQPQLDALYRELTSHPMVKVVL
ncbi:YbeD family protein [Denitromonas iodatirespirans]|uniref:UPF0250 protein I8J34_13330 n=1 Tax=Denitromonas iodatirespirans TaxID=2795389 RepID=A0A944DB79_DENI1|nr:DUF493 family protein [Denitromonas iodatirespirans]MBT0962157.1 DUF493 family protein [Denitromonas iodatirespirans]